MSIDSIFLRIESVLSCCPGEHSYDKTCLAREFMPEDPAQWLIEISDLMPDASGEEDDIPAKLRAVAAYIRKYDKSGICSICKHREHRHDNRDWADCLDCPQGARFHSFRA